MQRTLVLCKPDCVQRRLIGRIISRIEDKGLKIVGMKMLQVEEGLANRHYQEHTEKPFFRDLVNFITSSPIVVLAVEGINAVEVIRRIIGATNPQQAAPGTIRGDFGLGLTMNLVHGSDSVQSAGRELGLFFSAGELFDFDLALESWV
ncbi:MAG: nucleoside-diphosphate kinase [Candidatus Bipolaricaulota bacterium]|nr:nucleoside-diphosphate kinase [Candidatus Bipolaricaulota bacterium]